MNSSYAGRILSSWRFPAFALLVITTHLVVETLRQAGFSRFTLFLASSNSIPLNRRQHHGRTKALVGSDIQRGMPDLLRLRFHRHTWMARH